MKIKSGSMQKKGEELTLGPIEIKGEVLTANKEVLGCMDQALTQQNFWNKSQKFFFTETNAKSCADQSQNHAQASTGTELEYQIF